MTLCSARRTAWMSATTGSGPVCPVPKKLFAELLGCRAEECFIGGSAHADADGDTIAKAYTHGLLHSEAP